MELKISLNPFFSITLYWFVAAFFTTLIISIFSSFIPLEKLQSYFDYGFNLQSFRYFELTLQFYFFVSFLMAAPGFLLNIGIYFFKRKNKNHFSAKYASIALNMLIAGGVLIIYDSFNISRRTDIIFIITPIYLFSIAGWGLLILPSGSKEDTFADHIDSKR